jgi:hypothetical protein
MRKLIFQLLVFILPVIGLLWPLDYFLSYNIKKSNEYPGEIEVMNDIYSGNINSDIAVYGSSRAWSHFNSRIMEDSLKLKVYNFGIDGHNFWIQYLRHLEYIKHNIKPKLIIMEVDIFTLQKRVDLNEPIQFMPYMLWNTNIRNYTLSYNYFNKIDYYIPLIRYAGKRNAILTALKNISKPFDGSKKYRYRGYAGELLEWTDDFDKAKKTMKQYKIVLDAASIALFERFIRECKQSNIKLVFVYTPEYIEGQQFVANRKNIMDIYSGFAKKYNIPFLDYSNDELSFHKELFYNTSHLKSKGADLFTSKLTSDLKNINSIGIGSKGTAIRN